MSEQAGPSHYGGANRHHKPKPFAPIDFEPFAGGPILRASPRPPTSPPRHWCATDATATIPSSPNAWSS
ncbi:hypothetical protein AHiyo4_03670 [Arthrobacter sp. Hiyo4]|nr:hypothetical protein AHiyo4_03670 [Arthrobacter sp. Hiyo4]